MCSIVGRKEAGISALGNSESPQAATADQLAKSLNCTAAYGSYQLGRSGSGIWAGTLRADHSYSVVVPAVVIFGCSAVWRGWMNKGRPAGQTSRKYRCITGTSSCSKGCAV